RSVSATAAISSSPIAGGWKPSVVSRRVRIDLEAYGSCRTAGSREGVLRVVADGENRACSVWPSAQRHEDVAGATVGAPPPDALDSLCLLDPVNGSQTPFRRDEKENARAGGRVCLGGFRHGNRLAEGEREREV